MRLPFFFVSFWAVACSSGTTGTEGDGGASVVPVDSGSETSNPSCSKDTEGCNTLRVGPIVTTTCKQGTAPAPTGGTIAEGTYVLSALAQYGGSCSTPGAELPSRRGAAAYRAGVLEEAVDGDPTCKDQLSQGVSRSSSTVTTSGSQLTAQVTCATRGTLDSVKRSYSTIGDSLVLLETGPSGYASIKTYTLVR